MKKNLSFGMVGMLMIALLTMAFRPMDQSMMNTDLERGGRGGGRSIVPLSEEEAAGLVEAIEEEYLARALYESIMDTFGEVSPFAEIAFSESKHADTLIRQAEKYGVDVPAYDPESFDLPIFETLDAAYQAGVDAEIADAALYDQLLLDVTHDDLVRVYTNLQRASLENHLVSFQAYLNE
jgi:hypothetical protein